MSKKYLASIEVLKYPYNGRTDETKDYLSEKICCYTIKIRKRVTKKVKLLIISVDFVLRVMNGVTPSEATQAIGLPFSLQRPAIMRSIHSNTDLFKQAIIAQVMQQMPAEIDFSEQEMNELYRLSVECKNNFLSQEELIAKITNLRGGSFVDVVAALGIVGAIIIILVNNASGFHNPRVIVVPPHTQWLYGNNNQPGQFGYGKNVGPRTITVTGMTQNAGSDKIEIQVHDQIYIIKNNHRKSAEELKYILANRIYQSIRESDTDICDIAQNVGFKADNIKNIKDHVFYNEHNLDRYDEKVERKQFDPDLQQALAWKRLENGTHTQDDIMWIKHECAERHHELKYDSGYNEAHKRAQTRFDGSPWEDKW